VISSLLLLFESIYAIQAESQQAQTVYQDGSGLSKRTVREQNPFSQQLFSKLPTACVTGGWGKTTHEMGNY